jgi:hypothetical protein
VYPLGITRSAAAVAAEEEPDVDAMYGGPLELG